MISVMSDREGNNRMKEMLVLPVCSLLPQKKEENVRRENNGRENV